MKKTLQRFGASVLAAAMVAQSVALPAAAETTKINGTRGWGIGEKGNRIPVRCCLK